MVSSQTSSHLKTMIPSLERKPIMIRVALFGLLLAAGPAMAQKPIGARDRATILSSDDPAARASQDRYGYSEAVLIDGTLYLSGVVVGLGAQGDTLDAAYDRAFRHIGAILRRAGLDWRDVVDITSFHTDLTTQLDVMAKVKGRYITPRFPTWTAIGVSRLVPDRGLTEIKIIARAPRPAR